MDVMKKGYIQSVSTAVEFQKIITEMNDAGIDSDHITINQSFDDFAKTVAAGDVVVVYSLDCFRSISEFVRVASELTERGILLESLTDSWCHISPETLPVIRGVVELSQHIRGRNSKTALQKAKSQGKTLGRPVGSRKIDKKIIDVEKLLQQSGISVAKACATIGCNTRSFYRYRKKRDGRKMVAEGEKA